ncbi:sugar phosphate isomerase/epimerase family protein [Miniphocaeibacter halophilus]|uniref:TIM barrel protein n=1 Tax=Miniphocaeibacter halophilus TaxID=2931922 RepID=A0AC61MSS9_9FIRM|nr:TIM barrel protein [Miniphocaeibacter halophilus]QQK08739.1 TIM barrel protein [Miniphocaeibacter halophilus]
MKKKQLCIMNHHYQFYSIEEVFKTANGLGIENIEMWTAPQHLYVDYLNYDSLEKIIGYSKKYNVKIACICPEQTNPKPNNMAAIDENQRRRTQDYFRNIVDIASITGAGKVVVTSGWGFLDISREKSWNYSIDMMKRICSYAEKRNVQLCIEALQLTESNLVNNIKDLYRYLNEVNSDYLNICIDLGAASIAGDSIDEYFNIFGEKIKHCHFVDVGEDTHLAWGDGSRDMLEDLMVFKKYGYEGYLSMEIASSRYHKKPFLADKQSYSKFIENIEKVNSIVRKKI